MKNGVYAHYVDIESKIKRKNRRIDLDTCRWAELRKSILFLTSAIIQPNFFQSCDH